MPTVEIPGGEGAIASLRAIVHATARHSATRFLWFGKASPPAPEHLRPILATRPDVARQHLHGAIAHRLYGDFYQAGRARPATSSGPVARSPDGWGPFVDELSAANMGSGTRQAGWVVIDDGQSDGGEHLTIRREGLTLRVSRDEIDVSGIGPPRSGDDAELLLPKHLPAISPGFYTALADEPYDARNLPVVRLYWNVQPWGAATLTRAITTRLNGARLPFRLKLVNHPDHYDRCDAAVLYLLKRDLDAAAPLLAEVYGEVSDDLRSRVPALTKSIAPGVGLAEDPPGGDSFGQHCCWLLAGGLIEGWECGATTVDERLTVVVATFERAGIDPARPYLNLDAVDDYDMTFVRRPGSTDSRPRARATTSHGDAGETYLDVATEIGREICEEAYWHGGRCNWLGVLPRSALAPPHQELTYRSLGPDLYGGSSGIALFLAELAGAAGDEAARRTALGSIRHAIGRARDIAPPVHLGLYTGRPGLALVAHRVGMLLEVEDVVAGARSLLEDLAADLDTPHEHDLLSGSAGAIVALRRLANVLDDLSLIDRALRLGERLAASAHRDERGCSWSSLVSPESPNLTGLSHGAAGIGLALLELWRASEDERYYRLAGEAFAFERSWFSRDEANWPDFRTVDDLAARVDRPLPSATHWCHGAPGIALARLRAWELTGDARYRDEAIMGLETTRRAVVAALEDGTANYSLCHGLAGNAEILVLGGSTLGSGFEHLSETGYAVARAGIELYARHGRSWPCGTRGGWTPNLMLGLAGIGRFYLRLARPALPSVLLFPTLS
jgi:hypothetical protein